MRKILYIISNLPDNLGDFIQIRNIIRVLRQLRNLIIDDHYLNEEHCRSLGLSQTQLLSNNRHFPDLRKLTGVLKLVFGRNRQYDAVARGPAAREYRYDTVSIIHQLGSLLIYTLLHLKGIKIYQFGMTSDPSKLRGILLRIERAQSRMHSIYSVRDINVYEQLKALHFTNLFYCPDIFYWDTPKTSHYDGIERQGGIPTVLISLRRNIPNHPDESGYECKLMGKVSAIIDSLHKDTRIIFSYQVLADYEINLLLFEKHKARGNCDFIESCLHEHSAESIYSKCDLIISNRQHCLLYGAKLGIPIMALTDVNLHWKLRGAIHDLGISDYLADINDDDAHVINKCKEILQQRDSISNKLMIAVRKKRDEAMKFLRERLRPEIEVI